MEKIIKTAVYQLVLNQQRAVLYSVGEKINIFDVSNNFNKVKVLDDLKNPNQVFYEEDLGILIVNNTTGSFAFYDLNNYNLLQKFTLENIYNTDNDFIYDIKSKSIYLIATFEKENLEHKLVIINLETQNIDYIPLEYDKGNRILVSYSIQKIEAQYLYLFKSIIDTNKGKVLESTYGKYTIEENNVLKVDKILWKNNLDFGRMRIINESLAYGYECIVDLSQQKAYPLDKIKKRLSKTPIYNASYYNNRLAVVTSDIIYFTSDFEHIIDTIDGKYLSCYLETDEYKFVGSWEYLKIISKN